MSDKIVQTAEVNPPPDGYRDAYYLSVTDPQKLAWLNILSLVLLVPFILLMWLWTSSVQDMRGAYDTSLNAIPGIVFWLVVIGVLPLHELVHGLAIQATGYTPRYGAKYTLVGKVKIPYILYATADGVYFTRNQFIVIALAPVIVITLLGLLLVYILPDFMALYIGAAVVINGSGAVGDLWMTAVALRYPASALVLDEADSITIYVT